MDFTYASYINLLQLLQKNEYQSCSYQNWDTHQKPVILRHDIDNSPALAAKLSDVEYKQGIHSTFFVLLATEFYNPYEQQTCDDLQNILKNGSQLGLHFDEKRYQSVLAPLIDSEDWNGYQDALRFFIKREANILSQICDHAITIVSMHRPSACLLEQNLQIDGMINSYSNFFFKEFKYLSDSRRHWREPVEQIIASNTFAKLHILTHAFWYRETDISMKNTIKSYVQQARKERYDAYKSNFRDLDDVLTWQEIEEAPL